MYARLLKLPKDDSVLLFGPRGVGKTSLLDTMDAQAVRIDLLDDDVYRRLLNQPTRLREWTDQAKKGQPIFIDEIQKVPALLDEVHLQIEKQKRVFVLTGSSARKLKAAGVNLLGGRAQTHLLHPLTACELRKSFDLDKALQYGLLPKAYSLKNPAAFLSSYVKTYLKEEVLQEGLTRNLGPFSRFLEAASFSQASVLNYSNLASDTGIPRRTVQSYFELVEDLLLGVRLPVFLKRAKRDMSQHPKFLFFDAGVYRTLRPKGPLDRPEEIDGAALETLVFQELRALNDYLQLGYTLSFWRTAEHLEVDFIVYGERGFLAIEVKRSNRIRDEDLKGLRLFGNDYPTANRILLYGGKETIVRDGIRITPLLKFFESASVWLSNPAREFGASLSKQDFT
ncbi:AAA family ATPase [Bdellovibrionota bacterium FG-1]